MSKATKAEQTVIEAAKRLVAAIEADHAAMMVKQLAAQTPDYRAEAFIRAARDINKTHADFCHAELALFEAVRTLGKAEANG